MKTHLETHKIEPKIGFYRDFKSPNPDFGPGQMDLCVNNDNQPKWLLHPQLVCIKPIKPMKTYLRTPKIGPKIGCYLNFKLPNPDFWPGHMDLSVG